MLRHPNLHLLLEMRLHSREQSRTIPSLTIQQLGPTHQHAGPGRMTAVAPWRLMEHPQEQLFPSLMATGAPDRAHTSGGGSATPQGSVLACPRHVRSEWAFNFLHCNGETDPMIFPCIDCSSVTGCCNCCFFSPREINAWVAPLPYLLHCISDVRNAPVTEEPDFKCDLGKEQLCWRQCDIFPGTPCSLRVTLLSAFRAPVRCEHPWHFAPLCSFSPTLISLIRTYLKKCVCPLMRYSMDINTTDCSAAWAAGLGNLCEIPQPIPGRGLKCMYK